MTTTATPEPPEPEPFKLSDRESDAIADAVGIRRDIVPLLAGDTYTDVREAAQRVFDGVPSARVEQEPKRVDNGDKLSKAASLANVIRARLGVTNRG